MFASKCLIIINVFTRTECLKLSKVVSNNKHNFESQEPDKSSNIFPSYGSITKDESGIGWYNVMLFQYCNIMLYQYYFTCLARFNHCSKSLDSCGNVIFHQLY